MKRREFIAGLGGAAAWPVVAHAQHSAMPVIGFLSGFSPSASLDMLDSFRQGLGDIGYFEHQNVGIEYRWAEGQYDRLPAMAADLVRRPVAVIFTMPTAATLAAKSATMTVPIVFTTAADPVQVGLVASLNRPGGKCHGCDVLCCSAGSKAARGPASAGPQRRDGRGAHQPERAGERRTQIRDLRNAANALGLRLHVLGVVSEGDANAAFATLVGERADALFVTADGHLQRALRDPIVALAARHRLPTMYPYRDFVAFGGLICYTSSSTDAARQAGVYAGRILKGAQSQRPASHPADQVRVGDQSQDR